MFENFDFKIVFYIFYKKGRYFAKIIHNLDDGILSINEKSNASFDPKVSQPSIIIYSKFNFVSNSTFNECKFKFRYY